jgi:hypothetical protein
VDREIASMQSLHEVHFVLPVDASWTQLIKAQSTFLELLREVSRTVVGTLDDPVDWVVKRVRESSADLALVPVPRSPTLPRQSLHEIAEAVPEGMRILKRGERPRYFTERALKLTTTLTKILPAASPALRTRNGSGEVEITEAASLQASRGSMSPTRPTECL